MMIFLSKYNFITENVKLNIFNNETYIDIVNHMMLKLLWNSMKYNIIFSLGDSLKINIQGNINCLIKMKKLPLLL